MLDLLMPRFFCKPSKPPTRCHAIQNPNRSNMVELTQPRRTVFSSGKAASRGLLIDLFAAKYSSHDFSSAPRARPSPSGDDMRSALKSAMLSHSVVLKSATTRVRLTATTRLGGTPDSARSTVRFPDPARLERAATLTKLRAGRAITGWTRLGRGQRRFSLVRPQLREQQPTRGFPEIFYTRSSRRATRACRATRLRSSFFYVAKSR